MQPKSTKYPQEGIILYKEIRYLKIYLEFK